MVLPGNICVILRLLQCFAFDPTDVFLSSDAVQCRIFISVLRVGAVNLLRARGLYSIGNILILSILYFYRYVKLILGTILVIERQLFANEAD